jgi:hypothetical protein
VTSTIAASRPSKPARAIACFSSCSAFRMKTTTPAGGPFSPPTARNRPMPSPGEDSMGKGSEVIGAREFMARAATAARPGAARKSTPRIKLFEGGHR